MKISIVVVMEELNLRFSPPNIYRDFKLSCCSTFKISLIVAATMLLFENFNICYNVAAAMLLLKNWIC
jgi:hypothetical protein